MKKKVEEGEEEKKKRKADGEQRHGGKAPSQTEEEIWYRDKNNSPGPDPKLVHSHTNPRTPPEKTERRRTERNK